MATRFSRWNNTEYVPLPTDYYQMAIMQQEQMAQKQIDLAQQAMYQFRSLTPASKDAQAYYDQTLQKLNEELQSVGKMNLQTPEALAKINSLISNPQYLNAFRGVARDTENVKLAQKARTDYVKESGNDINAVEILQAMTGMANEQGDASKFNPNRFDNLSVIPKYIEIQPEVDKIIKEMKEKKGYRDFTTNNWVTIEKWEELSADDIRKAVLGQLGSRNDLALQLQRNIKYDAFRSNPDNPEAAILQRGQSILQGLETGLNTNSQTLNEAVNNKAEFIKKYNLDEKKYELALKQLKDNDERLRSYMEGYASSEDPNSYLQNLVTEQYTDRIANASASLFSHYSTSLDKKVNPYGLAKYQSDLALGRMKAGKEMDLQNWLFKQQFINQQTQNGTAEVKLGLGGDAVMNADAEKRMKNGDWIGDFKIPGITNTRNVSLGGINDITVQNKAKSLGWDGKGTPMGYLQQVWQKQGERPVGFVNGSINQDEIVKTIVGSQTGLKIYENGKELKDPTKRSAAMNMLQQYTTTNPNKDVNKIAALPLTTGPNGQIGYYMVNPADGKTSYFIELPKGLADKFGQANRISQLERDPSFVKGETVITQDNEKYYLTRVPNSGTSALVGYKDAGDINLVMTAKNEITKVARQLMRNAGHKVTDKTVVIDNDYYKEAVRLINQEYQAIANSNTDPSSFTVAGVKLALPAFTVLNDDDFNGDKSLSTTATSALKLRVGTIVPTKVNGRVVGGALDGKSLEMRMMELGINQLPSNRKYQTVEENSTEKTRTNTSLSITNSSYDYDE